MQDNISKDEIAGHLEQLDRAREEDVDELLIDFLVTAWPTRVAQDN
jgi:hypothetical protein